MKLLLFTLLLGSVSSWSITSWINNSFQDCLGSTNFLWNTHENCNTGKEILENFDFETVDEAPFSTSMRQHSPRKPKKNQNAKAQACIQNPKFLLEIGIVAQGLIKKKCQKSKLIFSGKLVKKDKFIKFTLECPEKSLKEERIIECPINKNTVKTTTPSIKSSTTTKKSTTSTTTRRYKPICEKGKKKNKKTKYTPSVYLDGKLYSYTFVNDLDEDVSGYWINYKGKKKHYFTLEPKERIQQFSYKGHRWVFDNDERDLFSIKTGFGKFRKLKDTFKISKLAEKDKKDDCNDKKKDKCKHGKKHKKCKDKKKGKKFKHDKKDKKHGKHHKHGKDEKHH